MNIHRTLSVGDRLIGRGQPPFIIAEMSGNHNQSLDRAFELVDEAANAGVHAIKLQTYTADTMTLNLDQREFLIDDPSSPWRGNSLYQLYEKAHTPWDWHEPLFERIRQHGIVPFSTPFDESAVEFLESLDVPCYKIASFENNHLPLIRRIARTGKPIIMSTGMASLGEIDEALRAARAGGCEDIVLLKCTSAYPASADDANIATIPILRDLFDCEIGVSDHTLGLGVAVASVALGAVVVEKHFTLNRQEGGVDSEFSMEPAEMKQLVTECERGWRALGEICIGRTKAEASSAVHRRSLYIAEDIVEGEELTTRNLRCIRPGLGLAPKYYEELLGRRVARNLRKGTAMRWEYLHT